jgi:hypothetical protein
MFVTRSKVANPTKNEGIVTGRDFCFHFLWDLPLYKHRMTLSKPGFEPDSTKNEKVHDLLCKNLRYNGF